MPLTEELYAKLKSTICKHLKIDESTDEAEIEQELVEAWTSAKHLSLIMEIEHKFKVKFSIDEIVKMTSFEVLADCIADKLKMCV